MTRSEFRKFAADACDAKIMPSREVGRYTPICRYRGAEGTKCAIGILIDDEDYHEKWNSCGYLNIPEVVQEKICLEGLTMEQMQSIQIAHDDCPSTIGFKEEFLRRLDELPFMQEEKEVVS